MNKREHYLAYTTNDDSAFQTSNIKVTENEFELINSKLMGIEQYENNYYYLMMVVWSYEDVQKLLNDFRQEYIQTLRGGELLRPEHFELNGRDINLILNSEIIKTLALADIYLDYFEAYFRRYHSDALSDFKNISHAKYENSFSYRFCNELRDYSIHYSLPLEFVKVLRSPININNTEYESVKLVGRFGSVDAYLNPIFYHDYEEDIDYVKSCEGNSEEFDFKLIVSKDKLVNSGFNWKRNFEQELTDQEDFIDIASHLYHYIEAIIEIHKKSTKYLLSAISIDAKFIFDFGDKLNIKNNDIEEIYIKTVLINENTGEIIPDEEEYSSLGIQRLLEFIKE